jgi:hypothetical protein
MRHHTSIECVEQNIDVGDWQIGGRETMPRASLYSAKLVCRPAPSPARALVRKERAGVGVADSILSQRHRSAYWVK